MNIIFIGRLNAFFFWNKRFADIKPAVCIIEISWLVLI